MKETNEISALLHLIDDPDTEVYISVRNKLLSFGKEVIPNLEYLWETTDNPFIQERVEMLIHSVQFEDIKSKLTEWMQQKEPDILMGAFIVNSYHFPELSYAEISQQLEKIRRNIWLELNPYLTNLEQINVLTGILFQYYNFKHHPIDYTRPADFLLSYLLETKKGNSLGLTILQLIIAQLSDIPIQLLQVPGQLVLGYSKSYPIGEEPGEQIHTHFFLDGGSGQIFSRKEIELYLKKVGIEWSEEYFKPLSSKKIIAQLIDEYASCFQSDDLTYKYKELKILAEIIRGDSL